MKARGSTQDSSQSNVTLRKTPQLGCSITVMIQIHLCPYPNLKKQDSNKNGKYYINSNIQLDKTNERSLVFHHFGKYDSYEFTFDEIFSQNTRSQEIYSQLTVCSDIIKQNRDVCALVIGGSHSGIREVTEGTSKREGLFYTIVSRIWEELQAGRQRDGPREPSSIQMSLKMLVQHNEKLFDILRPKSDVSLKENEGRSHIAGCSSHSIKSVLDLYSLLKEGFEQRQLIYPGSIAVIEVEVTLRSEGALADDQKISKRYITLISWQKSTIESHNSKANNNQSLLALNMCLFQLYKFSCCDPRKLDRHSMKKLLAIFRNSPITLIMRAFFLNNCRFLLLGCLSADEKQEDENFHTLMLSKNFGKINLSSFVELRTQDIEQSFKPVNLAINRHRKMRSEAVQPHSSNSSGADLSRLKENLKKILRQKQQIDCSRKREDLIGIFKEQKFKLRELENLRYKREEDKFMQKLNKIQSTFSITNSKTDTQVQNIILPSLENKRNNPDVSMRKEDSMFEEVEALEERILEKAREEPNILLRDVLKMQVKKHQEQMVGFIQHKNKLMDILKKQIMAITPSKKSEGRQKKIMSYSIEKKPKIARKTPLLEEINRKQSDYQENLQLSANPQTHLQTSTIEDQSKQKDTNHLTKDLLRLRSLKKFNKVDYLFEKKRLMLKAKVEKGRQQLNKFYEEAAQKFQQYRQPKK